MEAHSVTVNNCSEIEDTGTDSLADILSSSDSSLTSLTTDNLLQQFTTEDETLKSDTKFEKSDRSTKSESASNSSQLPDFSTHEWYLHPLFQRYWKHYSYAMSWCQNHLRVTHKLQQNQHNVYQRHSQPYARQCFNHKQNKFNPSKQHMFKVQEHFQNTQSEQKKSRHHKVSFSEDSTTCDDSLLSDAESEVYEMEITEEMVDFFAKSEKHRKERDEDKKTGDGKIELLVDIGKASKKIPTSEAPKERPGLRRTTEMTQLYGKGAAMIHGMETALQMTYDRNVDIKQPPYWPNMPLKIKFN